MAPKRQRLTARRKAMGFTLESLAAALDVQRTTVGRWELGDSEPAAWIRPVLANTLNLSPEQLDDLLADPDISATTACADTTRRELVSGTELPGGAQVLGSDLQHPGQTRYPPDLELAIVDLGRRDLPEIDDMHRRGLLRLFSIVGTMLALPDIGDDLHDDSELNSYARLNSHLWQVFALASSKAEVLPLVRQHQEVLAANLARTRGSATRQQLCALIADLFQLAGEIHFDANSYTEAAHCYTLAAQAGKQAGAFDLWACAMTRHAFLSVYELKFQDAAPMLELAAELARRGDSSLSTRHWVAVVQAETFAGQGNLSACQTALDTAEGVRDLTGPVHTGGWLRFDGARLAEERGTCYTTLGRPDLAETALTEALRQELSPRRRASVLTDLAVIGAQRRDPDQVVVYADAALAQARRTGSGVIGSKLHGLQRHLAPLLANKQIDRLNTEINALIGASATR